MGIRPAIVREDVPRWAPAAARPFDAAYAPPAGCAVLCDMSQMMHTLARPAAAEREVMRGHELQAAFRRRVGHLLQWRGVEAAALVCIMDQAAHVPPEKGATQARRRAASGHKPYARDTELGPDGVRAPGGAWEPLDMRRVARSAHMNEATARFLQRALHDWAPGARVLIDAFEAGPLSGAADAAHQERHRHGLGEADLALVYWTRWFGPEHAVVHVNVDGDEVPIMLAELARGPRPRELHWVQHWSAARTKPAVVVDLLALYDAVAAPPGDEPAPKRARPHARRLHGGWAAHLEAPADRVLATLVYVVLLGTDYFQHAELVRYAPRDVVWQSLQHAWPYVAAALRWRARDPADHSALKAVAAAFEYVVRQELFLMFDRLLHDDVDGAPELVGLPEDLAPAAAPLVHPPALRVLQAYALNELKRDPRRLPCAPADPAAAYAALCFNLAYWRAL